MISFSCPSRGRPTLAKRLVDTATETQEGNTEFLFYLNDDDPTLEQYKDLLDEKHYTVGPNQSTCYSWNLMAKKAKHDILMLMGDDDSTFDGLCGDKAVAPTISKLSKQRYKR